MTFNFHPIEAALQDLKSGKMLVVVDDEARENEGDLVGAAQFATPAMINFMATHGRGLICLAMTAERLDELDLPLMVDRNTDANQTAFTISIDSRHGTTTGISADDRSCTIQTAIHPNTRPTDLRRPGHVFPLRSREGGVLKRAGHTEAAVDLAKMSGLYPAGVICEIQNEDGSMARLPQLIEYADRFDLKIISIADLISYRLAHEKLIHLEAIAQLPSLFGEFKVYAYRNHLDGSEHLAIVKGDKAQFSTSEVMVRVHSECLTGDALGSLRCDCRGQLQSALKMIEHAGSGVIVYLRQEGRGIGLINKIKAYALQDTGMDTVEANEHLGFAPDLRSYGIGAQILHDLGVRRMKLITNNPRKIAGLKGFNLEIVDRVPLLIETNDYNQRYLATKAEKLGHLLLKYRLATLVIHWRDHHFQEWLSQIRSESHQLNLLVQEETVPELLTKLGLASRHGIAPEVTVIHIGTDREDIPEIEATAQLKKLLGFIRLNPVINQLYVGLPQVKSQLWMELEEKFTPFFYNQTETLTVPQGEESP